MKKLTHRTHRRLRLRPPSDRPVSRSPSLPKIKAPTPAQLMNDFLFKTTSHPNIAIVYQAHHEEQDTYLLLIARTKTLKVTASYNASTFQPHDKVTTQEYTVLYALQFGTDIEDYSEIPVIQSLITSGLKLNKVNSDYEVTSLAETICSDI